MEENFGIKGELHVVLRDKNGNIIQEQLINNTITNLMDAHVADQMSDSGDSQIGFIALGTGTGQGASDVDLAIYSAATLIALSGTVQGTAGDDNDSGFWDA